MGLSCVPGCAQSCPTPCDHMDCSPPGSSLQGISSARLLNMLTISYSRGSFQPRDRTWVSCVSCSGRRSLYQVCYLCSIESSPERKFSSAIIWKRPKPSPCPSEGAGQLLGPKQMWSACVEPSTHLPPQTCERCHPSRQKWKAAETTVTTRLSSGCRKIWAMAEAQRLPREIPVWRCRWYAI